VVTWAFDQKGYSQRRACALLSIAPKTYRYASSRGDDGEFRETGFEPSIPLRNDPVFPRGTRGAWDQIGKCKRPSHPRDRWFESRFLQRRVCELSVPTSFSRVPVRTK
jgi:hypothetical protein